MNDNRPPADSGRFNVVRVLPHAVHARPVARVTRTPYASPLHGEDGGANAAGRLWSGALLFALLQGVLVAPLAVLTLALEFLPAFLLLPAASALPATWLVCLYVGRAGARDQTLGCTAAVVGSVFWGVPAVLLFLAGHGQGDGPSMIAQVLTIGLATAMLALAMNLPGVAVGGLLGCRHAKAMSRARQRRNRQARWRPVHAAPSLPHLLATCRRQRHG